MRFIAWLITLAENSDRIADAAADRLRAKLGGHTDMVVRIVHYLLITAGISSPLLMYFAERRCRCTFWSTPRFSPIL